MIEIVAAVSAASRAFSYIQQAVNKGHEINDLAQKFGAFFDAKDKISEAEANVENASAMSKLFDKSSVESAALQITMAKQKTQQMEKQLREIITYTVGQEVYVDMMRTRARIRKQRLEAVRAQAARRRLIIDGIGFAIIGTVLFACLFAVLAAVITR
jgi:CHASE3 domain sensor protein